MMSKKIVEMTLNDEEVIWLKNIMQNPREDDCNYDKKMRKIFFETLKKEIDSWEE